MKNPPSLILLSFTGLLSIAGSISAQNYPHTDPTNSQNWALVQNMSDEFDGTVVDEVKWQICGRNGVYWGGNPGFTGRGYPSSGYDTGWEFSPDNVRVEGGMLKITTKYDPNYNWVNNPNNYNFEYTTGGVWSKETFTYGYMEIRCKLPRAYTTGAFWTTGSGAELDVFEAVGTGPRIKKLWSSVHDWQYPSEPNNAWTQTKDISPTFDFGDGFHTYAAEWDETGVRIYVDGVLQYDVKKADVEAGVHQNPPNVPSTRWPLNAGQHVWADSEIFPWWGTSGSGALPVDYEVEYIRVWQKAPNAAPSFDSDPVVKAATEGVALVGSLSSDATDPDSDPITFTKVSGPGWLTVAANGDLSGTPSFGNVGTNEFTVEASAVGGSDSATLQVVVNPGPWRDFGTTHGLSGVKTDNKDSDSQDDWNEYVFGGDPDDASILGIVPVFDHTTGDYTFQLRNDAVLSARVRTTSNLVTGPWATHETINVTLNDGGMKTYVSSIPTGGSQMFVRLEVDDLTPVNQPPMFISGPLNFPSASASNAYSGSIFSDAMDPEGDPLSFSKTTGPPWLSVASDGTLSGTPSIGDAGANVFSVQVSAAGGIDTETLNILVNAGWNVINSEGFESGFGIWNDGGSDCRRSILDFQYAHGGSYCVQIRDDEESAHTTTDNIDISSYSQIRVEFWFDSTGMVSGDSFDLKLRDASGTFQTVASFDTGVDFNNGETTFKSIVVTSAEVSFSSTAQIRFECEAALNSHRVYLDDIVISGQ